MEDLTIPSTSQRERQLQQATLATIQDLRTIAQSAVIRELSSLSLPEIDEVVRRIARLVPAGNLPGMILSGLARLPERRPSSEMMQRDIQLLFRGVERVLDQALYSSFFAGPAAIIWGYQHLLKLAGKDVEAAFPEGTWQFYINYALRDDTARHATETHGFDTALAQRRITLSPADRLTAWVMAAAQTLHQYDALLENEWRERVHTHLLREVTRRKRDADRYIPLYRQWEKQRPYGLGSDAHSGETFPQYRRRAFDTFLNKEVRRLRAEMRGKWSALVSSAEAVDLPAYQQQMSILAYLEAGGYGEIRHRLNLCEAHIGIIYRGGYHLIPVCQDNAPTSLWAIRAQVAGLLEQRHYPTPIRLIELASVRRAALPELTGKFSRAAQAGLHTLRSAPILINIDGRSRRLPLSELRQTERGIGDHPLTLFDTGETMVFDQSHIFFDGAWGAALAEIMTIEALGWGLYLHSTGRPQTETTAPISLHLPIAPQETALINAAPRTSAEVCAETEMVDLKALLSLRKFFKRRSDLLQLTVNDLLILYRAIHAVTYQPAAELVAEVSALTTIDDTREAAQAALLSLEPSQVSPAILIPIDASEQSPRERLHPMSFEVPLQELDFVRLHDATVEAYTAAEKDRKAARHFRELQQTYLSHLAAFGIILSRAKARAVEGSSSSVQVIKLMAGLPVPVQRLLDQIPNQFDLLNDIIKGREVFSNIGMVAPTSTLTRFISAKDDNEKKTLAWGVLTDANDIMHISLRDFRPHVKLLIGCGQRSLAARLTQDYLDSYAAGFNSFVYDLRRITLAGEKG